MAKSKQAVQFEVHEMKIGRGCYVRMISPNAVATNINDFASEHDAVTWIAQQEAAAFRNRTKGAGW